MVRATVSETIGSNAPRSGAALQCLRFDPVISLWQAPQHFFEGDAHGEQSEYI
jgi:hypothetical protein